MSLVQRAKLILTNPQQEWQRIDPEPATPTSLFTGYAIPMAIAGAIGQLIGAILVIVVLYSLFAAFGGAAALIFGAAAGGSLVSVIVNGVVMLIVSLGIVFGMGMLTSALAPSFGGVKNDVAGLKVAVYASTANWVGGMLCVVPLLGNFLAFLLLFYSIYLFYMGSVIVQKVPQDRAVGFTAVMALIWLVVSWVIGFIVSLVLGLMLGAAQVASRAATF